MRGMILMPLALLLSGCIVGTAVDVVTTSQSEADEKRGREIRKAEEREGKARRKAEREARRQAERDD